jgi:hypothetical protein
MGVPLVKISDGSLVYELVRITAARLPAGGSFFASDGVASARKPGDEQALPLALRRGYGR